MFERGYLTLSRARGVPIRAHWSLPLGVFLFSGARLAPALWLGIAALIVVHELGHALLVSRAGLVNLGIDLTGFGGRCRFAGQPDEVQRAWIAWGGVLAQLALLVPTAVFAASFGPWKTPWLADLTEAWLWVNAVLIGINLLPVRPLDGAEAWPLFAHLWRRRRRRAKWKERLSRRDVNPPQTLSEALKEAER